ncbi:hypothetical protein SBY92_001404 [Candida maltosa Xu316]
MRNQFFHIPKMKVKMTTMMKMKNKLRLPIQQLTTPEQFYQILVLKKLKQIRI